MCGELRLGREEGECAKNQSECGKTCRKKVESKGGKQDEDDANSARDDCSGMVEFDVESEGSYREKQKGHVRIHECVEDMFLESHFKRNDWLPREVQ